MLQIAGLATYVFFKSSALSSAREKTVPGTQWYLACTEGSTANHREPEVAVRRNRAV